ncbi:ParB N-terminal domain-containing protein [Paenibacillus herberti]|uniref:Uncharacterized protein n=1 Tax=Paenibacillus herberti TaxID=1619309 RepID=A0A229NTY0_9BACL|nr:ParB N-terminal domain-containing protein [Paenibacillus herberti]OXM13318.1 hypothetical protein CGZ75_19815 [Paenibacillus herberti]
MHLERISLDSIIIENLLHDTLRNQAVSDRITKTEEDENPLHVEGPKNGKYIAFQGEHRIEALKKSGTKDTLCLVSDLSSEENRMIKRLRKELNIKRRSSYEIARMIEFLINRNYTIPQIASECTVNDSTVRNYLKVLESSPELRISSEQSGAGIHAIPSIENLTNFTPKVQQNITHRYMARNIFKPHIDSIKKLTK